MICPFTILVDTAEQHPWTFFNIRASNGGVYHVDCVRKQLGKWENKLYEPRGDYSIEGHEGQVHIERKSPTDCMQTLLGFNGRRDRFERELAVLEGMTTKAVIVECSLGYLVTETTKKDFGNKTHEERSRSLYGTILAFQSDYAVPWFFCDTRQFAEITCFRLLHRYWRKHT